MVVVVIIVPQLTKGKFDARVLAGPGPRGAGHGAAGAQRCEPRRLAKSPFASLIVPF